MKQSKQLPDETAVPGEKPSQQQEWPEDDVAEKYIKQGGKLEIPSEEEEDEVNRKLKESKQPKK